MVNINRLHPERRAQVISALVEGNPIRSVVHMTGVADHVWSVSEIVSLLASN
jgi:hypothetical protein